MTPARSPDPAAEAVSELREALGRVINPEAFKHGDPAYYGPDQLLQASSAAQRVALKTADALIAGPLGPLLADIAALRTRAEADHKRVTTALMEAQDWREEARKATADRDRLAEEVERLRAALKPFATFADDNVDEEGWSGGEQRQTIYTWFGPSDFRVAARALDTATGETKNG